MNREQIWIAKGYEIFAFEGPAGLKIERLAKAVVKNKASFYHFFADMDVFISHLLDHHLCAAYTMAEKESKAADQRQLIAVFIEHKVDLLFNRQLRIHRDKKGFKECFIKTNEISVPAILPIWQKIIGLEQEHYLSQMVFMLSIENFFLQISDDTLNESWLSNYFESIKQLVQQFRKVNENSILNGSD